MNFSKFIIGMIILSGFALSMAYFLGGLKDIYQTQGLDNSMPNTYNNLSSLASLTNEISGNALNGSTSSDAFDTTIYKKGVASVRLTVSGTNVIAAMFADISSRLYIPPWIPGQVIAIITLTLVLLLFGVFLRSFFQL